MLSSWVGDRCSEVRRCPYHPETRILGPSSAQGWCHPLGLIRILTSLNLNVTSFLIKPSR